MGRQKSTFWKADFREKKKSMEGSRSMKCAHNVDLAMIKIIGEGNSINVLLQYLIKKTYL